MFAICEKVMLGLKWTMRLSENAKKLFGTALDRSKNDKNPKYLGIIGIETSKAWDGSAKTIRITTQALVMSIADYCSPLWMNNSHVKQMDTQINVALRFITGSVKSTEIEWLKVLKPLKVFHLYSHSTERSRGDRMWKDRAQHRTYDLWQHPFSSEQPKIENPEALLVLLQRIPYMVSDHWSLWRNVGEIGGRLPKSTISSSLLTRQRKWTTWTGCR